MDIWEPGCYLAGLALLGMVPAFLYDVRSRAWLLGLSC